LILTAKRQAETSRRTFNEALRVQAAAREEKQKALRDKKLDAAEVELIDASYLYQQYHSPRCWKNEKDAFDIFEQLVFKKDRLSSVKEQILIRYLGLGWVEAHHPWSKKGHGTYSATELLEHFVRVVLPLEKTNTVPDEPPLALPGLPKSICRLGTRAQDCIDLETSLGSEEMDFRLKALRKRDSLEDNGFGDELAEMQQTIWPVKSLQKKGFKIDMLFEYKDENGPTLQWCQGEVTEIVSESKNKHVIVKIEWKDEYLSEGDQKVTRQKLLRTKWNTDKPTDGTWREDLYHKVLTIH
jgi:hypothetical protein